MHQITSGCGIEVLSERVLQQLARDTSRDALPRLLTVFMGEVKKRVQLIEEAFGNDDEAELREQTHALKSCAGTFGGLRLQESAKRLEEAASSGRAMKTPGLMEDLGKVAERTLIEYAQYQIDLENAS